MKLKHVIGILVFLLLAVGSASAAEQTAVLTEDNSNLGAAQIAQIPDGLIKVAVTYNPSLGTITYKYTGYEAYDGIHPYIESPKIDMIAYNLGIDGSVSPETWTKESNTRMDGFGLYSRKYTISGSNSNRLAQVTVTLNENTPTPLLPTTGNVVALHLAFSGAHKADGSLVDGLKDITLGEGSTYLTGGVTQVPEFPTMVLPVAAILGVMFIFGNRKKE